MKTQLKIMFLVKVSQGNSSEVSEVCSHTLFSSLTETLQVKVSRELSIQFHFPYPYWGFLGLVGCCCCLAGRLTVVNVVTN